MGGWQRETLWRQGSLLGEDAIRDLALSESFGDIVAIVASHDCDLAQDPGHEPLVEIIVGKLVTMDGNFTHAKNARKLHIEFTGPVVMWCEFEITAKKTIDKCQLSTFLPRTDVTLTPDNKTTFQLWLASRYRRSAFADEFDRRLTRETKLSDKITKAVKPHGDLITAVLFDVDDGREVPRTGPDDVYTLDIYILHVAEPDFQAAEQAAKKAVDDINLAFKAKLMTPKGQWQHIELRYCDAISESVLTYQQFRQLKRWRLDHVSLAAIPQQPPITE